MEGTPTRKKKWGLRIALIVAYWIVVAVVANVTLEWNSPGMLTVLLLVALIVAASQVILKKTRLWFESKTTQFGFYCLVFVISGFAASGALVRENAEYEGFLQSSEFQTAKTRVLESSELSDAELGDAAIVVRYLVNELPELRIRVEMLWRYKLLRDASSFLSLFSFIAWMTSKNSEKGLKAAINRKVAPEV